MEKDFIVSIGEMYDIEKGHNAPKQMMYISTAQFQIIETFASTRKDEDLNTVYKLNDIEFKVTPYFNFPYESK